MTVLALTGKDGGPLADLATVEIRAPHLGYADESIKKCGAVAVTMLLTIAGDIRRIAS